MWHRKNEHNYRIMYEIKLQNESYQQNKHTINVWKLIWHKSQPKQNTIYIHDHGPQNGHGPQHDIYCVHYYTFCI